MQRRHRPGAVASLRIFGLLAAGAAACGPDGALPLLPGEIETWAGNGQAAYDGDGNARLRTALYLPLDLEFGADGRAYILDWQSHRVRRVNTDETLETVIGSDFPGDGPTHGNDHHGAPGPSVELNHPTDLQALPDGTLLLAAWHNHKLRRLDPATGIVTVLCGGGPGGTGDEGPAASALLRQPKAVVAGSDGTVFILDSGNQRLRAVKPDGRMIAVAGTGERGSSGDGGPPLAAAFAFQETNENPEPGGALAIDAAGRLYVADTYNNRVRRIDLAAGVVDTVVGTGAAGGGGDGGPAVSATLARPRDLEIGPDGRLYIADTDNNRVRAVDLETGLIETVAGSGERGAGGDGGPATAATLSRPFGIAFDAAGSLYVADSFNHRIRRVAP